MGNGATDGEQAFWGDAADDIARERYQTLVDAIDDGIYQLDRRGRFVAVNDIVLEMTGYDRSELIGEPATRVLASEDRSRVERELRQQIATGEPCDTVGLEVETAEGDWIPVEVRPSVLEENGEFAGSIGVARDVSNRRQQSEHLEDARESYETITNVLDEADIGVFVLDDEFDIAWVDETIEEYFGLDRSALLGRDKPTVLDDEIAGVFEESARFRDTVRASYEDNSYVERFECRVTAGDDREERWLEHRSQPIESGQYAGGRVELYYDITDRKRSETALRESEAQFQTMIDAVEEYAIFRLDRQGRVISWNEGARRIKGYEREEILGDYVSTFYTESDRAAGIPETNLERADETGSAEDAGWRVRRDGSRFWANVTITAVRDDDGTHRGYVKVTRDMTDRREREQKLQRERDLIDRILEVSPVGIVVFDDGGDPVRCNDRSDDLLDIETSTTANGSETISDVSFDGTVFDDRGRRLTPSAYPVRQTIETGEPTLDRVLRIDRSDGSQQWLVTSAVSIEDDDQGDRTVAIVEDVTPIKRREVELESELEATVNRITDAFYALDDDWTFTYVNDRARALIDVEDQGLLGENIWDVFEWGADSKLREEYERAMETQDATSFELYYPAPLETWFDIHAYPSETGLSVYFRDISERKERDRELLESERRHRTLAEYFPNGIVTLFDHDLEYTLAAGQGFDRIPVDPDDLEGETVRDAWPAETADVLEPALESALDGSEETIELEYAEQEWQIRSVPITDEQGAIFAGMTMAQDITEQKERERYLEDAKSQLEAATEAGAVGTWEWHVDSDTFVADRSFAKTFGIDPETAREGVPIDRLLSSIHEDDRARVEAQIEDAVDSCGEYESEYRVRNGDGELRWVVARGHVECDDDSESVTFPGALTDITERKRAEIALEESRKQLETLFDVLPIGVVVANQDGEVTKANNTATEIWGGEYFHSGSVSPYERQTGVWADSGEPVAPEEWTLAQVLEGSAVTDPNVYEIETADGDRRIIMEHGMPIVDGDGAVSRAVVTMTEITERREYQRRLEQTIDQVEASNERLEHFAYAASHDLQEPLRMVSSYLQLIENRYGDELDADGQEFLEFAVDGADRMREMIDGLLAYSRVETQGEPFEPTDLERVIGDVLDDLQVQIRETGAEVTTESLPTVDGDSNQLRQLFQNLLSNALEYSGDEPPRVHIDAERNGSQWTIAVEDEGIGIDPADQDRIFEVFQRLHSRDSYTGTGIGLALCQRIAERHGGTVRVESTPGEGSTFLVSLPAIEG
ncbi:PAS domain S-box protein [Salinadaptatus halalkaliphilus]|uniref:histidine kinase n=1 Tax=Salinadaptatus halalkaliphilus TaxID=2419781 RepID=A0A4S3TI69_9EURY|nr:PAS domain S-box protein [Salinadaptatus halalkaliphilus]THE63622.1 PAS domain S-box protein [Salinadaptatus halalkaliphilus]